MAERTPSNDQAAFGVFPQLQRNRSKQDREAAKNVPIDLARGAVAGVLGAPGDIESFLRIPYDYFRAPTMSELVTGDKTSKTYLPTSEDIEKRLPLRSETPVSKAATGLGTLAGGFYNGPGSPLRAIGALPSAIKRGAQDFALASAAGAPHVIKPVGGNWVPSVGDPKRLKIDPLLNRLKKHNRPQDIPLAQKFADEARAQGNIEAAEMYERQIDDMVKTDATNKWVDANLRNYIRNEMGSPKDPVRDLADKGIKAFPVDEGEFGPLYARPRVGVKSAREHAGFPEEGVAQTPAGRHYETLTDNLITSGDAKYYQEAQKDPMNPKNAGMPMASWIQKLPPEEKLYSFRMTPDAPTFDDLGFNHIVDILREDVAAGRIRPEQLSKVSMEQAVRRAHEYDMQKLEEMRKAQLKVDQGLPVHKEYPEGYKWQELRHADDAATEAALKYEGQTMGHCVGGYCDDVLEGNTRIFSLRDAKGEPHVTIEVEPNQKPYPVSGEAFAMLPQATKAQYGQYVREWRQRNPDIQNLTDEHTTQALKEAGVPPQPDRIVQIKGKGNAKPKADYIPYVQDFVKGGNWSEVGDLRNTDLTDVRDYLNPETFKEYEKYKLNVPKYATDEQLDRLHNEYLRMAEPHNYKPEIPPPEGLKRGGVVISKNPDAMMLELGNKKLAEGGSVADYNTIPDMNDGGQINQGPPFKKGGKVAISKNKDAMWMATQDQKFNRGGKAKQILTEGLEALGFTKKGAEEVKQLSAEEKAVLEKWGQKQAQEAERAKKVEKMAKESASKSPEESVKRAKASTGKRTATPPDFYRKMAETEGDEAVLKAARAGKHLKPDTSGGYIGAPRTVDSPQALGKMRRDLDQDFIDSVDAVRLADPVRLGTWYDRAKSGMAQMTEPYQLPRTLEQHGVYSAGVAPESELTFALKHLNSRVYGDPKMAYRGAGMRTLDRAVAADEPAEMGFKIGEYADKNDPRLPNTGLFGVNDFRRAQGMGYTDPQGNPWKAGVSDTMHPFMDLETALQVDRANKATTGGRSDWYGPHIQELPWVYGKAQDLYSRGSSKTGRYGGDPLEGIKLALQDANKTAIDYAYKHAGSATHEAIPGASTGHVPSMIDAPLSERIAYGNEGRWDRPVPEAALNEFPEVGAGNRDVIYSALGYRQLPTIEASGAYLPEGASKYEMQPVKIARPLLDFPTGGEGLIAPDTKQLMDFSERFRALNDAQEAFGYNLPNTMGDVTGKNAAILDTRRLNPNRNLDPATGIPPSAEQMGALTAALGDSGYGIAPTSRGATIFPFDPSATTKDVNKLLKSKGKELEGIYPSDIETSLNSSGYGPGVGKYTPEGFTASEPFTGQATKGLLKEASYLPQSAIQNLSESEYVRQAIKEKMRRDAALPNARADIQNTRQFFAEADWAKAVDLIRKGMSPTAALAALGYSASSMAGEADR